MVGKCGVFLVKMNEWTCIYFHPFLNPNKITVKGFVKSVNTQGREERRGDTAIKLWRLESSGMNGKEREEKRMAVDNRLPGDPQNLCCRVGALGLDSTWTPARLFAAQLTPRSLLRLHSARGLPFSSPDGRPEAPGWEMGGVWHT